MRMETEGIGERAGVMRGEVWGGIVGEEMFSWRARLAMEEVMMVL